MDSPNVVDESALDIFAAKHMCVVSENMALAQENARLAQENAMLRMQAMAPATVEDALTTSWATVSPWDASIAHCGILGPSVPWQGFHPQSPHRRMKDISSSSVSVTSSLATTIGADSSTSSLNSACDDDADVEEKGAALQSAKPPQPLTTVMMRNMPIEYTREMLITLMNNQGFHGKYDFIYLPVDFTTSETNGYAFINFVTPAEAQRFQDHFQGFSQWDVASDKECDVTWSNVLQGLAAHVDRYRSSPVMHDDMPDECRPAVFSDGVRAPFPPPLKRIRAPRIRHSRGGEHKKIPS